MGAELAYVAVITMLVVSGLGISVWGLASIVNKIRNSRLEAMLPDGPEVPTPVPMPSLSEMEHIAFEQSKEEFKTFGGQWASDMVEAVQGEPRSDEEFLDFAKKQAEGNDPKVYGCLKPDTEYKFSEPAGGGWELAREYAQLTVEELNIHLRALCILLRYFPTPSQYLNDPFWLQWREMIKAREEQDAKQPPPMIVVNTSGVSDETVAKVREQFNSAWEPKKPKRHQAKRSAAFEASITKPAKRKGRARK